MNEDVLRVGLDRRITLNFSVSLMDGTVLDSTWGGSPATFQYGDGSLLPGFERAIVGLKAGDRRSVIIESANGFGLRNEENVQEIPRNRFAEDLALEQGLMISFANAGDGGELPGVVQQVSGDRVIVDFNHPLAGRDLTFDVEIISITSVVQTVELKSSAALSGEGKNDEN
jgi:FKBP-type peptidyl-prolyl cis-trans isomerase SlpA